MLEIRTNELDFGCVQLLAQADVFGVFAGLKSGFLFPLEFDHKERIMPIIAVDHHLKNFDKWFEIFSANPPPDIGNWRLIRGTDDPNRVRVIGELSASEVAGVKDFMESERMQKVFSQVNEMSTSPLEIVWFDEVTPG